MSTAPYNKGDKVVCMAAWHADHEVVGAVRTVASCEQSRITGKWYIRLVELVDPSPSHNYDAARYRPARTTDYPAPQPAGAGEQSLRNAFSVWAETQGNGEVSLLDVLSPIEAEAAFDNWKLTLVAAAPKAAQPEGGAKP